MPAGSLARGKLAVGRGPTPCASCHGQNLTGMGEAPSIAGRSPTYIFRQLYLFRHNGRRDELASLMTEPVSKMSERDMVDVTAYLASLQP